MIARIRNIEPRLDGERIIELFRKSQVAPERANAKTGFYEYPLTERDLLTRIKVCPWLSLVLEDNHGRFAAYLLAYQTRDISIGGLNRSYSDPVLKKLSRAAPRVVYVDQLCLKQGVPAFVAGRLVDVWTSILYGEKFEGKRMTGSVCAIPAQPWDNVASRRLALARGYSKVGQVKEEKVVLDIFAKPNLEKNVVFDSQENFLGVDFK